MDEGRQGRSLPLPKKTQQRALQQICRSEGRFLEKSTAQQRNKEEISGTDDVIQEWRSKYDQLVVSTLKEVQEVDEKTFNFKEFIVRATE